MAQIELRLALDDQESLSAALAASADQLDATTRVEHPDPGEADGAVPQVEPVTAMIVIATALTASKIVTDWWEKLRGGLVVDQRPGAVDEVRRDRDVPAGYVLTYPEDGGKVQIDVRDAPKDATERLLALILDGILKDVSAVGTAAAEAVGADKVTTDVA